LKYEHGRVHSLKSTFSAQDTQRHFVKYQYTADLFSPSLTTAPLFRYYLIDDITVSHTKWRL